MRGSHLCNVYFLYIFASFLADKAAEMCYFNLVIQRFKQEGEMGKENLFETGFKIWERMIKL